jgi:hypothetical protein
MGLFEWLATRIRNEVLKDFKVKGCDIAGQAWSVPNGTVTRLRLVHFDEIDPSLPFGFNETLKIPAGFGGRYVILTRIDWCKSHELLRWDITQNNSGYLLSFLATGGDPEQKLPGTRITTRPVFDARHTYQDMFWEGILDDEQAIEFFVRQTVSQNETYNPPDEDETKTVEVRAMLAAKIRRTGIQY